MRRGIVSKKTKQAKQAKKAQAAKPKKTFMQWATVGPVSYMVIGVICLFAGIYGIVKPEVFNGDGMLSYITTICVFFGLGAVLIVVGWRIKTGKAEMPKFRFFSNK